MRLLVVLLITAWVSCSSGKVPREYIQPANMQKIVWDLLLADEVALQMKIRDSAVVVKHQAFELYDQVFAIHGVTREQFYKSYAYYQEDPSLFKSLLVAVKDSSFQQRQLRDSIMLEK